MQCKGDFFDSHCDESLVYISSRFVIVNQFVGIVSSLINLLVHLYPLPGGEVV